MQTQPEIIDAHCHLQNEPIAADLPAVLARASQAGVTRVICNGTAVADWQQVLDIALQHPQVTPCLGLHPWYVSQASEGWLEQIESLAAANRCGIGEIGLDHWIKPRDQAAQDRAFREQLLLAGRLGRPASIHCLQAWGDMLAVLRELGVGVPLIFHAFGGPADIVPELAAMNAYFSFAGNVLDERKGRMRQSLLAVPIERLLIETDSPDLAPPPQWRPFGMTDSAGRPRNEPANLAAIVRGIAELRGLDLAELAAATRENALCLVEAME